jgi:BTB/POZ domain
VGREYCRTPVSHLSKIVKLKPSFFLCYLSRALNCLGRNGGKGVEPVSRLSIDIANIFENGKFADCTVACEGKEFRCHKNILSAR